MDLWYTHCVSGWPCDILIVFQDGPVIYSLCFRMAYFQQKGVLLSTGQLLVLIQSHYTQQALQQAYVLILGLDVLGNPYGLVRDFTQGLGDFFYEPFLVSGTALTDPRWVSSV